MIRTESEYRKTLERLEQNKTQIRSQRQHLEAQGFNTDQTERVLQPLLSFQAQLEEEIEIYDRLRRGELPTLYSLSDIGQWLIGVRISQGLSQKELAGRLNVSEQQISRDERNEYHGITVDRAEQILQTMGVQYRLEDDTSGQPAFSRNQSRYCSSSTARNTRNASFKFARSSGGVLTGRSKIKTRKCGAVGRNFSTGVPSDGGRNIRTGSAEGVKLERQAFSPLIPDPSLPGEKGALLLSRVATLPARCMFRVKKREWILV